jgi:hypothetical protein
MSAARPKLGPLRERPPDKALGRWSECDHRHDSFIFALRGSLHTRFFFKFAGYRSRFSETN